MHRLWAAVVSLLVIFVLGPVATEGGNAVNPSLTTDGSQSENDNALLRWASSRFTGADLDLPAVYVAFHDQKEACAGHPGLFRDQPELRIDICGFFDFSTAAKKTMLHELAHAWAHENLSDDDIEEFLILRGLEIWAGPLAPWELRGSEHAAEIISWALFDRELDLVTIPNAGPAAIEASYRILTGRSLPDRESKGHRAVQAPPFWRAWAIPTSSPWPPGAGSLSNYWDRRDGNLAPSLVSPEEAESAVCGDLLGQRENQWNLFIGER